MNRLASLFAILFSLNLLAAPAFGQEQKQPDDVIRLSVDLVQTDVMVFDKQGRFVDGLNREQFELRVNGKPVPVSFFERVAAGSAKEEQLTAARVRAPSTGPVEPTKIATDRGRTIIFFVDDLHLSADGVQRTRKAILNFIDKEMGLSDQVAIASASGQIGFLQQLTNNKAVLRAALERLKHKPYSVRDVEVVEMTEYQALRIEQGDTDALDYFVKLLEEQTKVKVAGGGMTGPTREVRAKIVRERAKFMLKVSADVSRATLGSLINLMQVMAEVPGRKRVFFFSDGFYLNDRNSNARDLLHNITDAATRTGTVIYSLDTRGLIVLDGPDASSNRSDPIGQLARANIGALTASQDPLNALAEDTGGRAQLNTFALTPAVNKALEETSNYYLLAWRPETEEEKSPKFKRIEVGIKGRPELTVRLARGYMDSSQSVPKESAKTAAASGEAKASAVKSVDTELRAALNTYAEKRGLPTLLSTSYLDTPTNGAVLTASVQVPTAAAAMGAKDKQAAAVDLAGVVLNDQGKTATTFRTRLNVAPASADAQGTDDSSVIYNYRAPLKPGIYQIRVAARADANGRVGSAIQWIEIPDLSNKRLTLSSLLVGRRVAGAGEQGKEAQPQMQFSVDRRFPRSSPLSFMILIYNARQTSGGTPDITAQIQIFRREQVNGQPVIASPMQKLPAEAMSDPARIFYGGDLKLANLSPGKYILQVNVADRAAGVTESQRILFDVE